MAFPATRLPVTVEIAPGADPAADPGTWTWVDITSSVRLRDQIHITQGRADEAARVDPSTCRLRLDNRSGNFTPRNPLGAYYGTLGRNTPLRVRIVRVKDTFTRTVADGWGTSDSGHVWTTTGGAASDYSVNGTRGLISLDSISTSRNVTAAGAMTNVDITVDIQVPVLATGGFIGAGLLARWDGTNFYLARVEFGPGTGINLTLFRVDPGTTTLATAAVTSTFHSTGTTYSLRFQIIGNVLRVKFWQKSQGEPAAWDIEHTDTAPYSGSGAVGCRAQLQTGNTNTLPVVPQFDDFIEASDRFSGFVSAWPPRWDKSGRDATVPIEANGVLRRLSQGTPPSHSPLRRSIGVSGPAAYWPVEDGGDAAAVGSAISAHPQMSVSGTVAFAQPQDWITPGGNVAIGSLPAADLKDGGSLSVSIPGPATAAMASVWAIQCLSRFDLGTTASAEMVVLDWSTPGGTFVRWELRHSTLNEAKVLAYNAAGTATTVINFNGTVSGTALRRVTAAQVGGNIDVKLYISSSATPTASATVAGTLAGPTSVAVNTTGVTNSAGHPFGHLAMWASANPSFRMGNVADGYGTLVGPALIGWLNETAHDRLARLCAENGVTLTMPAVGVEFITRLGTQPAGTFLDLAQQCATDDQGVIYESGFALRYVPREHRYNRPVSLALDFAQGQVAEPPEPADDDQQLRNRWTVRRSGGSSARAEDGASIAAVGPYDDEITVNHIDDKALAEHAAWRVHLGT